MHLPNHRQRFLKTILRDRWRNVLLPMVQSVAIVIVISPLVYLKIATRLRSIEHQNEVPQIARVETIVALPDNTVGEYRYAGTAKIAGGTVIGYSRIPLHAGQTVAVVYRQNRFVIEPVSGSIQKTQP